MKKVELEKALEEANSEIEYLKKLLEPQVRDMSIQNGEFNMELTGNVIKNFALALSEYFLALGAENYVNVNLHDQEGAEYIFSFQKASGKTPHQLMEEWKKKYQDLYTRVSEFLVSEEL